MEKTEWTQAMAELGQILSCLNDSEDGKNLFNEIAKTSSTLGNLIKGVWDGIADQMLEREVKRFKVYRDELGLTPEQTFELLLLNKKILFQSMTSTAGAVRSGVSSLKGAS